MKTPRASTLTFVEKVFILAQGILEEMIVGGDVGLEDYLQTGLSSGRLDVVTNLKQH